MRPAQRPDIGPFAHPADEDRTIETTAPPNEVLAALAADESPVVNARASDSDKTMAASTEWLDQLASHARRTDPPPGHQHPANSEPPTVAMMSPHRTSPAIPFVPFNTASPIATGPEIRPASHVLANLANGSARGSHRTLPLLIGGGILYVAAMAWLLWWIVASILRAVS